MRPLGPSTSLSTFRLDLVYLLAQLTTDDRPGIADLAPAVQNALEKIADERAALEEIEDQATIATALLHKRDRARNRLLASLDGVARSTAGALYVRLFPKRSPGQTARLGSDAEFGDISRVLDELGALDANHPLRLTYAQPLADAQTALSLAQSKADKASTALNLRRSRLERFKLDLDKLRLERHSQLVAMLKDRTCADSFFRSVTTAPSEDKPATLPPAQVPRPAQVAAV